MLEIKDGFQMPVNPKQAKVNAAKAAYEAGGISKKEATRLILASQGIRGFASYDAAFQYIERAI
jgi:hypothetical protein